MPRLGRARLRRHPLARRSTSAATKCIRWCRRIPARRCAPSRNSAPGRSPSRSPACSCSTSARTSPASPRLKVSGKPGQKITLRFAERLNPDGTIYTVNLRSARATDTYICKGKGTEIWQPRFTFHGFQYIEVTGLSGKPAKDTVIGVALSSDTPVVGAFTCSDPMLNQLHNNIYWTQRANFIDIPTDCPQRDERLGWTGDAQVYIRTATLNTDVEAFFTKWLVDLDDGQRADGQFPCVAPCVVAGNDGGPAWADAGVICPWTIYEVYGDRRVLERHYDAMKRFIEFCRQRSTPDLLPPDEVSLLWRLAQHQGRHPEGRHLHRLLRPLHAAGRARRRRARQGRTKPRPYEQLFEAIRDAFNRAYVSADGRIKGDTQTCYVLALAFDLVQGEQAKLAAKYLVADIEKRGWHLSTGFIGTKYLMLVLSQDWPARRRLSAAAQRHLPVLGLLHQAGRDQHLGTLGRLDAREGFPGCRHELLRALLLRRGLSVDGREHRRHPQRRARLQGDPHRARNWTTSSSRRRSPTAAFAG